MGKILFCLVTENVYVTDFITVGNSGLYWFGLI